MGTEETVGYRDGMAVIPKKERKPEGVVWTLYVPATVRADIAAAAKREGYSTSSFAVLLLKAGMELYERERESPPKR